MIYKLVFLAFCLSGVFANLHSDMKSFISFANQYGKTYSDLEFSQRFHVFSENLKIASAYQARETGSATYGVTEFMDMSPDEFRSTHLMPKGVYANKKKDPSAKVMKPLKKIELPASFDWRDSGAVSPVKNQGQCGSCWAFSATETIESYHYISQKQMVILSPQQIVDCDKDSYGCSGGWTEHAFNYVIKAGGQDTEASYPYTARDGSCRFKPADIGAKLKSWSYVTRNDNEGDMEQAIAQKGPLSVCVDASSWQYYTGGVLKSCGTDVDHCVQITGYSTQNGVKAWNVRNSWGTSWGVSGYIYLERGHNTCDIGSDVITLIE